MDYGCFVRIEEGIEGLIHNSELDWTTKNIKKTHARLVSEGVEISDVKDGRKPNTLVATIKSHTCNIPTLLIEHLK